MKRLFFLILVLLLLSEQSAAQSDTIHWGDSRFYWDAYYSPDSVTDWDYEDHFETDPDWNYSYYAYKRFIVNKEMTITGIAFGDGSANLYYNNLDDLFFCLDACPVINIKVYQGQNSYQLLDSLRITPTNLRSLAIHKGLFEYTRDIHHVDSLWEIPLTHPVAVHDTFWVGIVSIGWGSHGCTEFHTIVPHKDRWVAVNRDPNHMLSGTPDNPSMWKYWRTNSGALILPVLQMPPDTIDFSCQVPQRPVLDTFDGTYASIRWQPTPPLRQEFSFGRNLSDPDSNAIYSLLSVQDFYDFYDLEPGNFYAATLRNICRHQCPDHDTTWHSDWSETLRFYLPVSQPNDTTHINDTTAVAGGTIITLGNNVIYIDSLPYVIVGTDTIAFSDPRITLIDSTTLVLGGTLISTSTSGIPTLTTHPLTLYPNPTKGELRVERGQWQVQVLEVYDLKGRLLLRKDIPDPSSPIILHLADLPAGTYLLKATSPTGTAAQTFVKE